MAAAQKKKMMRAPVRKKPARPRTPKFLDEKYTGPEPDWSYAEDLGAEEYYRERVRVGFYYNYFFTAKDGKPWVLGWMKDNDYTKEQMSAVKIVPDKNQNLKVQLVDEGQKVQKVVLQQDDGIYFNINNWGV